MGNSASAPPPINTNTPSMGYVSIYTPNTAADSKQNLFTCTLNTLDAVSGNPTTMSINAVGIKNEYDLVSPNNNAQMLIMSQDSKYIFLNNDTPNAVFGAGNKFTIYYPYLFIYALKQYHTKIPLYTLYLPTALVATLASSGNNDALNKILENAEQADVIKYNTMPSSTADDKNKKLLYLLYIFTKQTGIQNPEYNNVAYFAKSLYDLYSSDLSNYCYNIQGTLTDTMNKTYKSLDCRNVPGGSTSFMPKIPFDFITFVQTNILFIAACVCCMCCLSSILSIFLIMNKSRRRRR